MSGGVPVLVGCIFVEHVLNSDGGDLFYKILLPHGGGGCINRYHLIRQIL